jgi:uncharacterized protein (DUF2384 family)
MLTHDSEKTKRDTAADKAGKKERSTFHPIQSADTAAEEALQANLRNEISSLFADPKEWLDADNPTFGGARPRDIIDSGHGEKVLDRLRAIKYGIFS